MTRSPALTTLTATVHMMTRMRNTVNGGPRYRVTTTNGVTFQTAPDTADSTGWVPDRIVGQLVTLTLDSRDRIVGIEPATAPAPAPRYLVTVPGVTIPATLTMDAILTAVDRGHPVTILSRYDG